MRWWYVNVVRYFVQIKKPNESDTIKRIRIAKCS